MPENNLHKYYVAELYDAKVYTAGVRVDNEKILSSIGYKALRFRHYKKDSLFTKFSRLINVFYFLIRCPKRSIVVFHVPFHARIYIFLQKMLKRKKIKTIAIIIDLEGLRDENAELFHDEIKQLNKFDFFVVHNEAMKNKLAKFLRDKEMFIIHIFDYPSPLQPIPRHFEKSICIAGNLNKAKFIYQLNKIKGIQFNLYGEGFDQSISESTNVFYKGIFNPSELINNLQGSFGLVWDGTDIETCDGNTGKYLKYNNPYKFSLYIAAGLPVIAWKESAIASFIKKNNIGLTVNSLFELEGELQNLSERDYAEMQQNIIILSEQVRSGYFLKTVMEKITSEI